MIVRIRRKNGIPFLPGEILEELDHNKKGDAEINRNARAVVRELNKAPSAKVQNLPTGQELLPGDVLTRFLYEGGGVFLLGRSTDRTNANHGGRIIELARDYGMVFLTRDGAMKRRADGLGVSAVLWTGPVRTASSSASPKAIPQRTNNSGLTPFALPASPISEQDQPCPVRFLPKDGDTVVLANGQRLQLGPLISEGGEGRIHHTASEGMVCKIYHADKLTVLRRKKIELMVTRKVQRSGICWPTDIVLNENGEFLGYLMPRAMGKTVQSSMFVKAVLEKQFPQWTRVDLVNLCIVFLEHIRYLHGLNIIVGDINPLNLLVTTDSDKLWIVDTDSFQIERFACPVGTVNFTAPEIQGLNYSQFLRTKEHELFAIATMLFMLLHPGKPPYSQQGGGSPADNIKAMDFPYWFRKDGDEYSGKNAPHGPWQVIWSNLPYQVKEAFHNTFRANKRTSVDEWLRVLKKYKYMLSQGQTTAELFPISFKIREPIEVSCGRCTSTFTASKPWVDKLAQQGKQPWCPACTSRVKLEILANKSMRDAQVSPNQVPTGKVGTQSSGNRPYQSLQKLPGTRPRTFPPRNTQVSGQTSPGGGIIGTLLRILFT